MPTRDAMADSLTGLEDRGAFLRALASARQAADVAVVLVALDSHQGARPAGHALKAAAAALSAGLRQGDALFRVGDDAFAVILAVNEADEAAAAAQRLEAGLGEPAPASVAVAVPQGAETDAALLARAERALRHPQQQAA